LRMIIIVIIISIMTVIIVTILATLTQFSRCLLTFGFNSTVTFVT